VLIIPPAHGQVYNGQGVLGGDPLREATPFNSYLGAIEQSVGDWKRAIRDHAEPWLAEGLEIRAYVVGRDEIPLEALLSPEIVIKTTETMGLYGGLAVSIIWGYERACVVENSMWLVLSFSDEDMYNITGQEFGHCLGLGHVTNNFPPHDVMAGLYADRIGQKDTHLHCVSNLNIAGLEARWGPNFGLPGAEMATLPFSDYRSLGCVKRWET
jgi:hypothetical protein